MSQRWPIRLLISARDAGAADTLGPVVEAALGDGRFQVHLLAAEPAFSRLAPLGGGSTRVTLPAATALDTTEARDLIALAGSVLERLRPDVVLTGLSGIDAGIDEALHMAATGRVPTVALQDFWGDINPVFPRKAGTYLVCDGRAADLTRQRVPAADVHVVGHTRYAGFGHLHPARMRADTRAALGLAPERPLIAFFSQPLWFLEGFTATCLGWLDGVAQVAPHAAVLIRPHPRDPTERVAEIGAAARVRGLDLLTPPAGLHDTLAACDVSLSVYSTTGVDHCFLLHHFDQPAGVPLYLLSEPEVQAFFHDCTALDDIPTTDQGMSLTVRHPATIADQLSLALRPDTCAQVWQCCRTALAPPRDAVAATLHVLETMGTTRNV